MVVEVDIQIVSPVDAASIPGKKSITQWVMSALPERDNAELTVRIVGKAEITQLNQTYRHKNQPTNVLSFPFDVPNVVPDCYLLGDIVICADVVALEAKNQKKTLESHWAHMVVHGVLHLLGYDHQIDEDAELMEALEVKTLALLGYANPYLGAIP